MGYMLFAHYHISPNVSHKLPQQPIQMLFHSSIKEPSDSSKINNKSKEPSDYSLTVIDVSMISVKHE